MTTKATQIKISRREAVLQIERQMQLTEGKSYSISHINNRMKRKDGKWIMESQCYRYEVTDGEPTDTTEAADTDETATQSDTTEATENVK